MPGLTGASRWTPRSSPGVTRRAVDGQDFMHLVLQCLQVLDQCALVAVAQLGPVLVPRIGIAGDAGVEHEVVGEWTAPFEPETLGVELPVADVERRWPLSRGLSSSIMSGTEPLCRYGAVAHMPFSGRARYSSMTWKSLAMSQLISSARAAFLGSAVYCPTTLSVTSLTQAPSGWLCCPSVIWRVAKLTAWRGSVPTASIG